MSVLIQKIVDKIGAEGPISFETFMDMALYYPEIAYYTRSSTSIGKAGDFYTSSHLHSIFGMMIGRQMEEMWEIMGRPEKFQIVEMGAGMGHLAKDILDYLKDREFFRHVDYTIIELNHAIREHQKSLLIEYEGKICWVASVGEVRSITGCFLSNELLDALPVHLVVMRDELMEVYLSLRGEQNDGQDNVFAEIERPCSEAVSSYCRDFSISLPEGYKTEVNLKIRDWLRTLNEKLERGFVLTIDYGYSSAEYYDEERNTGTLLCYYRHQVNDNPYQHIGEQDITAHVNFSSVKKWGEESGLRTDGYCPQGTYLVSLGIDEVITEIFGNPPDPFEVSKIKGLIFPQGLGASHQVMVQSKGIGTVQLRGFSIRNLAGRL
ncbi:MAG: SAM-dependent methyltransferase [Nitrospirae bacterium]|nr:SAM-dependent methyltransferase [Nitrospirota bacterium]